MSDPEVGHSVFVEGEGGLVSTIESTATVAVVAVVTATATTAVESTTTAATATESTTTATAIEGALLVLAFRLWAAFVYHNVTAINSRSVQGSDCSLTLFVVCHFNKSKALAAASEFVVNDLCRGDFAEFSEHVCQILIFQVPAQISNVNVHREMFLMIVSTVNNPREHA
ncbi:MAG: hypothetical protein RIQ34_789 [Bacteroidota bacterium]|jgi:hypothetical protein